jgi:hypothetical protein
MTLNTTRTDTANGRAPPETPVGTAIVKFERGEMQLALFWRGDGFVWFHGRKQFSRPLATTGAAVQFLRDLCELYNYTLDPALPPPDGEQAQRRFTEATVSVTLSGLK